MSYEISPATRLLILAMIFGVTGCAVTSDPAVPEIALPVAAPEVMTEPVSVAVATYPAPIAIIISQGLADYRELLYVFAAEMGRPYRVFELAHRSADTVRRELSVMRPASVIAVGAEALTLAVPLTNADVVYAGVFESPAGLRGVDAIPPFQMQLAYWQEVSPGLSRIGVVGSASVKDRIEALALACNEADIDLHSREVSSDKELLQAFRSMVPHIDGFVFLPDENVLSPDVIRKVIGHGIRNDLQILVYSPLMFELGAFLYVEPQQVDLASQIVALVDNTEPLRELTRMQARIQPDTRAQKISSTRSGASVAHDG